MISGGPSVVSRGYCFSFLVLQLAFRVVYCSFLGVFVVLSYSFVGVRHKHFCGFGFVVLGLYGVFVGIWCSQDDFAIFGVFVSSHQAF